MSTSLTVRPYEPVDEPHVLDLLNLTLGQGRAFERSLAFFRWKHLENPFGPSLMLLANGQELVGLRAFLRWQFRARDTIVPAVRAVDTATHPRYQRMGVFSRLTRASLERAAAEGVQFVFNTPNQYSLPGYLKLGWQFVGRTTIMVRPLRPLRMAAAALTRRPAHTDDGAPAGGTARDGGGDGAGHAVEALLAHGPGLEALLARDDAHAADGIRTLRSAAYLRWRYATAPSLEYRAAWAGDGTIQAAVIYRRTRRRGLAELSIAEVLFGEPRWGRAALRRALDEAPADYAVAHCAWATPHRQLLVSLGFMPVPRVGPNFTVRPLGDRPLDCDPASARNWRLSLGDLEVF
ncbi:MAG: GNAT family N-acetyltransferase [Armatimonadota bacterium]|nr:GNAT family N-acetyltransferase [Armatimonadota bacterium]